MDNYNLNKNYTINLGGNCTKLFKKLSNIDKHNRVLFENLSSYTLYSSNKFNNNLISHFSYMSKFNYLSTKFYGNLRFRKNMRLSWVFLNISCFSVSVNKKSYRGREFNYFTNFRLRNARLPFFSTRHYLNSFETQVRYFGINALSKDFKKFSISIFKKFPDSNVISDILHKDIIAHKKLNSLYLNVPIRVKNMRKKKFSVFPSFMINGFSFFQHTIYRQGGLNSFKNLFRAWNSEKKNFFFREIYSKKPENGFSKRFVIRSFYRNSKNFKNFLKKSFQETLNSQCLYTTKNPVYSSTKGEFIKSAFFKTNLIIWMGIIANLNLYNLSGLNFEDVLNSAYNSIIYRALKTTVNRFNCFSDSWYIRNSLHTPYLSGVIAFKSWKDSFLLSLHGLNFFFKKFKIFFFKKFKKSFIYKCMSFYKRAMVFHWLSEIGNNDGSEDGYDKLEGGGIIFFLKNKKYVPSSTRFFSYFRNSKESKSLVDIRKYSTWYWNSMFREKTSEDFTVSYNHSHGTFYYRWHKVFARMRFQSWPLIWLPKHIKQKFFSNYKYKFRYEKMRMLLESPYLKNFSILRYKKFSKRWKKQKKKEIISESFKKLKFGADIWRGQKVVDQWDSELGFKKSIRTLVNNLDYPVFFRLHPWGWEHTIFYLTRKFFINYYIEQFRFSYFSDMIKFSINHDSKFLSVKKSMHYIQHIFRFIPISLNKVVLTNYFSHFKEVNYKTRMVSVLPSLFFKSSQYLKPDYSKMYFKLLLSGMYKNC